MPERPMPERTDDERARLHPLGFEDATEGLLRAGPTADPAAILDAATFADPAVAKAMNGGGEFISHEQLMEKLAES